MPMRQTAVSPSSDLTSIASTAIPSVADQSLSDLRKAGAVPREHHKPQAIDASSFALKLRLENYFLGHTFAAGVFFDRFGTIRRRMTMEAVGTPFEGGLTLVELLRFDDGEIEKRTWQINRVGANGYRASAEGVHGDAVGEVHGPNLRWVYGFSIPIGAGRSLRLNVDEQMTLLPNSMLLCRSHFRKFGVKVGELVLGFNRRSG
jgi:hypothetical protein